KYYLLVIFIITHSELPVPPMFRFSYLLIMTYDYLGIKYKVHSCAFGTMVGGINTRIYLVFLFWSVTTAIMN
ncbi:MAG: hypothetical protein Q3X96_03930, partial [Dorea sp.]|nr:hypothetical protein [Dorea sp.]